MTDYRFHGSTIRLTYDDYEKWRKRYHKIPDLEAALWMLDDFYTSEEVGNWFIRCSAALANKHQEWVLKRQDETAETVRDNITRPATEAEERMYMNEKPWRFNYNPDDEPLTGRVPIDWAPRLRAVE